jgi:hypothetical protein
LFFSFRARPDVDGYVSPAATPEFLGAVRQRTPVTFLCFAKEK